MPSRRTAASSRRATAGRPSSTAVRATTSRASSASTTQPAAASAAAQRRPARRTDPSGVPPAGNRWSAEGPAYPAAFALRPEFAGWVVPVGAIDESIVPGPAAPLPPRASFGNTGPGIDLYAPGVGVVGPRPVPAAAGQRHGWATWSGTSFAAATVTGVLARMLLADPGLPAARALDGLRRRATPIPGAGGPGIVWARDSTWPGAWVSR
ncbi:S8 family serine peptidase [Dactylosporangium roseum]|uniref:S8 family serine peptidase n=1 Tax=Dactylosporangium roseum TaxID=47989 RepID=A0ABY5YV90_9ACTN|nr:S8 family serine peptidase [Dactylosporangium roseum]UWZ33666.1 S8 family serine peptidase [Dactylosporangium roseum]